MRQNEQMQKEFEEYVVKINRTAKVVKGGRRFSFNALVVAGNKSGSVGFGFGKANEVPSAVDKAYKKAVKSMIRIPIKGTSIPHKIIGKSGASRVLLMPASPGTGIIACAAVRSVIEALGITDILSKSFGSNNPINIVRAVVEGLKQLRSRSEIESLRGVNLMELDEKEAVYEKAVAEALVRQEKVQTYQRQLEEEKMRKMDESKKRKDSKGKGRRPQKGGDRRSFDKPAGEDGKIEIKKRPTLRRRPTGDSSETIDKPADADEVKTDAKPETKLDAIPEVKANATPEIKADSKPEVKTETKPEVIADDKPEVKTDDKPDKKKPDDPKDK